MEEGRSREETIERHGVIPLGYRSTCRHSEVQGHPAEERFISTEREHGQNEEGRRKKEEEGRGQAHRQYEDLYRTEEKDRNITSAFGGTRIRNDTTYNVNRAGGTNRYLFYSKFLSFVTSSSSLSY